MIKLTLSSQFFICFQLCSTKILIFFVIKYIFNWRFWNMNYYNEVESLIRKNEINKRVLALQDNS